MSPFLVAVLAVTGTIFVWGLVSARSAWRVLVGWTRSDPQASEPGAFAYGVARVLCAVGMVGVLAVLAQWVIPRLEPPLVAQAPRPAIAEELWGIPAPVLVDRAFTVTGVAPKGLVDQRLTGYQVVDPAALSPGYLFLLPALRGEGLAAEPGFLGGIHAPGTTALDTANLVVSIRIDILCIPQQVVVSESSTVVHVAVFVGQQRPESGLNDANLAKCIANPSLARTTSYLIPIDLGSPLGDRRVEGLDGAAVPGVDVPTG